VQQTFLLFTMLLALQSIAYAQNVGVGTTNPLQRLDVNGNIRLTGAIMPNGDAGITGQALISNGPGQPASWRATAVTGGGRFWCTIQDNANTTSSSSGRGGWNMVSTSQNDSLDFNTSSVSGTDITVHNEGTINNYLTINRSGLYHFEGSVRFSITTNVINSAIPQCQLAVRFNRPAGGDPIMQLFEEPLTEISNTSTNIYTRQQRFSIDIHLEAGTTVGFITAFSNMQFLPLLQVSVSGSGYLGGYFIAE
jgi:hypothetical protein